MSFEVHEHHFTSGPRSSAGYRNGVWTETKFSHSHAGGSEPHTHAHTGPAFYRHHRFQKRKLTKKATGEQMEVVPIPPEDLTFDLVLTDSALIHGETPVGDTPTEELGMPAADRMVDSFRLRCIVRDERKGRRA